MDPFQAAITVLCRDRCRNRRSGVLSERDIEKKFDVIEQNSIAFRFGNDPLEKMLDMTRALPLGQIQ